MGSACGPVGRAGVVLAVLILLAGCKDEKSAGQAVAASVEPARQAAEQDLRASLAKAKQVAFRGVQSYPQAIPDRVAVCGQVSPFPDDSGIFVPFVSIGAVAGGKGAPQYRFDQVFVGTTPADAGRVYQAIVNYCYEKGGPQAGPIPGVRPIPPQPDSIPDPSVRAAPAAAVQGAQATAIPPVPGVMPADATPASGSVTIRTAANVHSDPHGATVRTVQGGTVLRVFSQATGGWYQVGDTAPWGWVHESMLSKR